MLHPTALPAAPGSARRARQLLIATLQRVGREDAVRHGLAELLVSELATNAIRYGAGEEFWITIGVDEAHVLVEVEDANPVVPEARQALPAEEGGRGLDLVRVLASAWGARPSERGKVVWFRLSLDRHP